MKLLSKFCVAWATQREADEGARSNTNDALGSCDAPSIAFTLSTRIVSRGKKRALLNMTSGLDMLALALTISREVRILLLVSYSSIFILRSRMVGSSLI
jgi:hypothetical protein